MSTGKARLVEMASISAKFGIDNSNLRKKLVNEGIELTLLRVKKRRNQLCLHLTARDARKIVSRLIRQGYIPYKREF